jgi:hypothetical protein
VGPKDRQRIIKILKERKRGRKKKTSMCATKESI